MIIFTLILIASNYLIAFLLPIKLNLVKTFFILIVIIPLFTILCFILLSILKDNLIHSINIKWFISFIMSVGYIYLIYIRLFIVEKLKRNKKNPITKILNGSLKNEALFFATGISIFQFLFIWINLPNK